MSVEPSTRVTLPSIFTDRLTDDFSPALNQYPTPSPRPRLGPVSLDFQWSLFLIASRHSTMPMRG